MQFYDAYQDPDTNKWKEKNERKLSEGFILRLIKRLTQNLHMQQSAENRKRSLDHHSINVFLVSLFIK